MEGGSDSCCHKTYKWTYQAEQDTMSCFPLIPPCIVLGSLPLAAEQPRVTLCPRLDTMEGARYGVLGSSGSQGTIKYVHLEEHILCFANFYASKILVDTI